MILERIKLIPRYNWDYNFIDLYKGINSIFTDKVEIDEIFEKIFGEKPIFTNSGRASLYAILKSLNIPSGSFVGVPLFCCPVVFDVIKKADLTPKFIDINLDDYNISPEDLSKKISSISAVIVVHMFGNPADMDSIKNICKNVPIIEDCAQSLFTKYKGKYTGFHSIASFYSFRSGKYISAGEGSAIFCKDSYQRSFLEKIVKSFDEKGMVNELVHCSTTYIKSFFYKKPWYGIIGRPIGKLLDKKLNLTAKDGFECGKIKKSDLGVIEGKIKNFKEKIDKQRENAKILLKKINLSEAILPIEKEGCLSNYYQFPIRFKSTAHRDFTSDYLLKKGIDSAKYLDELIDLVKNKYEYVGDCPNAELASKTVLVIPHYYTLSKKELIYIGDTLNAIEHLLPN